MCCITALAASAVFVFLPEVQELSTLFQERYRAPLPAESAVVLFLTEAEVAFTEKVHGSPRQELPAQTAE